MQRYRHADLEHLAQMLQASEAKRKLIISDAVFSMDGDVADIPGLLALADEHDALLLLDDAHGLGVMGPQGRGAWRPPA
jgi:8-amino-7-oxononanoate synthase